MVDAVAGGRTVDGGWLAALHSSVQSMRFGWLVDKLRGLNCVVLVLCTVLCCFWG